MALEDILRVKIEEDVATAERNRQERDALEAAEREEVERQRIEAIKTQITDLQSQKTQLEENLNALKASYVEAGSKLGTFKTESMKIDSVLANPTYTDLLAKMPTKNKENIDKVGIEDKGDLMRATEFQNDEDVVGYRGAGQNLRVSVESVKDIKDEMIATNPDVELNFRGGKMGGETQSPRGESFERLEAKITELDKKIVDLELQTPEGKERIYEKQVSECLREIGDKKQGLGNLAPYPRDIIKVSTLGFTGDHNNLRPVVARLLPMYGDEVLSEAVFRNFAEELQRIEDENQDLASNRLQRARFKEIATAALKAKIDFDILDLKREELIKRGIENVKDKKNEIRNNELNVKVGIPKINEMREVEDSMEDMIKIDGPYPSPEVGHGYKPKDAIPLKVLSAQYVSSVARRMETEISGLEAELKNLSAEIEMSEKNKPWILGKKDHLEKEKNLKIRRGRINDSLRSLRPKLVDQIDRDEKFPPVREGLTKFLKDYGLVGEKCMQRSNITVSEFLNEAERLLKEKAEQKLTLEEESALKEYEKVEDGLRNARKFLDAIKNGDRV